MIRFFKKKASSGISTHVTAINGQVIARPTDKIDQDFMNRLLSQRPVEVRVSPLVAHTEVFSHFERLLEDPKYRFISDDGRNTGRLLDILSMIQTNDFIIKELNFMKRFSYHYHHVLVVSSLAARLTFDLFDNRDMACEAASCGLTHDFGIVRVPLDILEKQASLNGREQAILREHPQYSRLLLTYYFGDSRHPHVVVGHEHHEDLTGGGYPRGITEIHPLAQCIHLCDIYDALITARPFRPAVPPNQALDILHQKARTGAVSPELVALLATYT